MNKFIICEDYFKDILSLSESKELFNFFKDKKYLNLNNELSIRFFMYYMNYIIELPSNLECKRKEIFKEINKFNFTETDFMDYKAAYKRKPYGFKD